MKTLKKQYETPSEGYDGERIEREHELREDYGLASKKEIYKAQSQLRDLRREARTQIAEQDEEQKQQLLRKTHELGLTRKDAKLEDILTLNVTDILNRRLQTAVNRRGHSDTPKEARQLVTHGHVYVDGQKVTIPGYQLTTKEEKKLEVRMPEPSQEDEETENAEESAEEENQEQNNEEGEE